MLVLLVVERDEHQQRQVVPTVEQEQLLVAVTGVVGDVEIQGNPLSSLAAQAVAAEGSVVGVAVAAADAENTLVQHVANGVADLLRFTRVGQTGLASTAFSCMELPSLMTLGFVEDDDCRLGNEFWKRTDCFVGWDMMKVLFGGVNDL